MCIRDRSPILIASGILIGAVIGSWLAIRVEMTGMPELVALFNGFGGAASALVALAEIYSALESDTIPNGLELHVAWTAIGLSALVGWMTLTGSLVAFAKLKGGFNILGKWRRFPTWGPAWLNPVKAIAVGTAFYMIYLSVMTLSLIHI